MVQLYTNNAVSTLAAGISDSDLSMAVASGHGARFPNPSGGDYFLVTLYQFSGGLEVNHEIVMCTARATDTLTIVRAQESTTARAFSSGDPVELRLTAGGLAALKAEALAASPSPVGAKLYMHNYHGGF